MEPVQRFRAAAMDVFITIRLMNFPAKPEYGPGSRGKLGSYHHDLLDQ
jgi:hypothetical protein